MFELLSAPAAVRVPAPARVRGWQGEEAEVWELAVLVFVFPGHCCPADAHRLLMETVNKLLKLIVKI